MWELSRAKIAAMDKVWEERRKVPKPKGKNKKGGLSPLIISEAHSMRLARRTTDLSGETLQDTETSGVNSKGNEEGLDWTSDGGDTELDDSDDGADNTSSSSNSTSGTKDIVDDRSRLHVSNGYITSSCSGLAG